MNEPATDRIEAAPEEEPVHATENAWVRMCRGAGNACTAMAEWIACQQATYGSNPHLRYTASHRLTVGKNREDDGVEMLGCEKQLQTSLGTLGIALAALLLGMAMLGKAKH